MKVSVVIAVEAVSDYLPQTIQKILEGDFQDLEILVFLSQPATINFPKTRFIVRPDLAAKPAARRDLAVAEAQGEILAFLDDDAYPSPHWLLAALPHFDNPRVAAVGGPGITPPEDNWKSQVSGFVQTSPVAAGSFSFRTRSEKPRQVDDYPSMNLMVRKSDFVMIGGFDSHFWPGEDTKLCLDLTYKLNKKIIYEPEALVYHHRRPIFIPHLLQVGRYGLHRGFFVKVLPQTSRRFIYFLPAALLLSLVFGTIAVVVFRIFNFQFSLPAGQAGIFNWQKLWLFYSLFFVVYFLLLVFNSFWVWQRSKSFKVAFWTVPAVFLSHLWYGFQFLRGLTSPQLRQ